jgi:uncharacterized protein (TIGR00255 family)
MESMTGYGEGRAENARLRVLATARSLNHRALDVAVRVPERLRPLESRIIVLARSRLARGRTEVRVEVEYLDEEDFQVSFRLEVLRAFGDILRQAEKQGLAVGAPTAGDILRLPEAVVVEGRRGGAEEEGETCILAAVEAALDQLVVSRRDEGAKIKAVLRERLERLSRLVGELDGMREEVQAGIERRLNDRLEEIRSGGIDQDRLAQEVAFLIERSDIQEELDRLRFHLTTFREGLEAKEPVGKRLGFLSQEIMRELNTIGSKCRDSVAVQRVVDSKVLCEQLREQIQNVQ